MHYSREPFTPKAEQCDVVRRCAERINPDNPELDAWYREYVEKQSLRISFDLDLVRRHAPQGAAVVEFGALPLLLTAPLQEAGYNLQAVDIGPERFSKSIAKLGLAVTRCDIERETLPFDDDSFDLAVFNELFEHLRINPIHTMREVRRVLKPGGMLMLSSPNMRSLAGIGNFLIKNECYSCAPDPFEQYSRLERLGHMGHVREYTTRELASFLTRVGFEVREIVYRGTFGKAWADALCRVANPLRPLASYIAVKPASH